VRATDAEVAAHHALIDRIEQAAGEHGCLWKALETDRG
jgi:hypothetical protein